ncbi:hypothetical protein [Actinoplanes subglobosus]|uniref:Integral membrane protein n=1 Tax=Actinoplanes subglobosus TaxID=1547892 RepID=A0ABV8IZT5_9ACTN
MTTTPRGGTATTRTARNRTRRRQNNAAGEPRHAAAQADLAPPRRRGGRHAAEEPAAALDDVEFPAPGSLEIPAPAWDPWATSTRQALPAGRTDDPLESSGVVDRHAFWADPADSGYVPARDGQPATWADTTGVHEVWTAGTGTDAAAGDWTGDTGAGWAGTGGRGSNDTSLSWAYTSGGWDVSGAASPDEDVAPAWLDLDEDDARLVPEGGEASSVDGGARGPYRKKGIEAGRRHIGRWSHARRPRIAYLNAALVRCGLYLGPLSVAIAAAEPLGRVAWPVPAVMLLLGWTAAQGLTSLGMAVAGRGGPAAAARTVGAGFAAVIGFWCALAWIAPDALLGPDRLLAVTTGIGGLAALAVVTAALVTRAEGVVAGWFTPCWLLAAAVMAGAAGVTHAALVPVQTLLPAAIVAVAIRAFRPALLPARAVRTANPTAADRRRAARTTAADRRPAGRAPRLTAADRRRAAAYLIIGAAQAVSVVLLWRGGPAVMPLPAALPLLLAVPLLEGLIGWHTDRLDAGLDAAETPEEFDRHVRNVTAITLAGLLPPLAAGCGLLIAAYRLPYGLSGVPGARDAVLALAAATLLGGVFAVTFLLAARTRHGIAATLAAIPPLAAAVLVLSAPPAGLLPAAVAVLAATHLAGLLIVALTAADLRRTP